MKQFKTLTAIIAILLLAFVPLTFAQIMSGDHNNSQTSSETTMAQCGMKNMKNMMDTKGTGMMDMMKNMPQQCQQMSQDFETMEGSFQKMLQMDDINSIKVELQKQYTMMQSINKQMTEHMNMCRQMMSSDKSGNMESGNNMMNGKMMSK